MKYIRPLEKSDIEECIAMAIESFGESEYPSDQYDTIEEEFSMGLKDEHWSRPNYFVCLFNNQIIGMIGYSQSWSDWDTFEFFWLSVRKEYKGMGIGRMLVEHIEQECIKKSIFKDDITIILSCTKKIIKFYKKNRYKVILKKAGGKEVVMGKTFLK